MAFSGDLRDINLADVFQNINANRLTGTVTVSQVSGKRYVYFREGMVAGFSLGINRGLPMGDHLVQRQYVDSAALNRANKRKSSTRTTLREALAGLGYLDEADFKSACQELVGEHLYDLLPVRDAEFTFTDGKPVPRAFDAEQKCLKLSIDPGAILMESARREDEMSRIRQVIASDHDIFTMVEGWQEYELDGPAAEAAVWLDGRTDIASLVQKLPLSRFDALKAVYDLVKDDLARPLGNREMEHMVQDALKSGHPEEAVSLLNRALQSERNNDKLRLQLAEVLERAGRKDEAADQLAVLGYNAAQKGDIGAAVDFYTRAAGLKPRDVALQEKCVELLREHEPDSYVEALLSFVDELHAAGLSEKARMVLNGAECDPATEHGVAVRSRLAKIESDLGHYAEAAGIYVGLARHRRKGDVDGRLHWLRKARELVPGDAELAAEVEDLETGRSAARRRARRRIAAMLVTLSMVLGAGTMGVVELIASHRLLRTLDTEMERIAIGRPHFALPDLRGVAKDYRWTLAGQRAGRLAQRMFELQLEAFDAMLAEGHPKQAVEGLLEFRDRTVDSEQLAIVEAMVERARAEVPAAALFKRINKLSPDIEAPQEFARLTDPVLVDFHIARLQRSEGVLPTAREAILRVLREMNHPRAFAAVARVYVHSEDPNLRLPCSEILQRAAAHRAAGKEEVWEGVYPELTAARRNPLKAMRAGQALEWLRGS